jgi:phage-related protein
MNRRDVKFYRNEKGIAPIQDFLRDLPLQARQKVSWTLKVVQEMERVPKEYLKKLHGTEEIWEIRVASFGVAIRLLGFFDDGQLIILTNGFSKKSQKTPQKEIHLAEERKRDYIKRRKKS